MIEAYDDEGMYRMWLLERVIGSVRSGAQTLHEVIAAAGGADPVTVRDALRSAVKGGLLAEGALADAAIGHVDDSVVEPLLPPVHPLDFEWRFSRRGADYLLSRAAELGGGDLCLIASTTVALHAASEGWQGRLMSLDANGLVLESANRLRPQIEIAHLDVARDVLPKFQASTVIADPPWYPEYIPGFLWASARLCAADGHVLLIVPGEGTRPAINSERTAVLRMAAMYGLNVVEIQPQTIGYETPLFEHNAIRAAGITTPIRFWRKGDLVVFRRTAMLESDRPVPPMGIGSWTELSAEGTRIRFRRTTQWAGCFPQLRSIVPGDVLPTVSRRDPRRAEADVWTSGNRVYACESPDILRAVTVAAIRGSSAVEAVEAFLGRELNSIEAQAVSGALDQAMRLIEIECDEQAKYVREISCGEVRAA